MKCFATAVCIFCILTCSAQKKSRIVFFRMDEPIGTKSSPFADWRLYTDELIRNNSVIAKMRSSSIFIYNTDTLEGEYFLAPHVSTYIDANRIKLAEYGGVVVFVKISLGNKIPLTSYSEVIDLTEFEECYDHAKWLKNKLNDCGYTCVKDLIKGYYPLPKESLEKTKKIASVANKRNIKDTVFLDEYDLPTERNNAEYFSVIKSDSGGLFIVTDYFLATGNIKRVGHFTTIDSEIKVGLFQSYFKSGNLCSKGNFKENRMDGNWEYYYDTLNSPVWYKCFYKNGNKEGVLRSYYVSGKLKREEFHQFYLDTVFYRVHKEQKFFVRGRDSVSDGRRFDELGNAIKFTAFEKIPTPLFNLPQFLARTLRYPDFARKHNIEGRVLIRFVVDTLGQLKNPVIIKSVSEDIDREARRAISLMPSWNPGIQDDKFEGFVYTLPIVFKLD
jgi:TonB family protein